MKTFLFQAYLAIVALVVTTNFVACDKDDDVVNEPCTHITNPIVTEMRTVGDFNRVLLEGIGTVLLTQGTQKPLRIETHAEVLDVLETEVVGGELQIRLTDCVEGMIDRLDIFVSTPEFERIQVDGVGTFVAQNDFDLDNLEIELNGVGDVVLQGVCDRFELESAGVGNIHAFDLSTDICFVAISGTGNAEVTVDSLLDVTISGAGNVFYKGDPMINVDVSGTGNLIDSN
ncbi:MAG: DUF2807 domain-containing protein [Saprospiraceae bacterium]|nr:DUF2807 domain-containing protein [Saprospiraceae bacterium]